VGGAADARRQPARARERVLRPRRALARGSALLLAAALLAAARAQADGPGLALGESERLHLFFESELRYDSLAGQGGIGQTGTPVYNPGDFILHVRPGARFLETGTIVSFTGSANIDYVDYTGWLAPTHDLSYLGVAVQGVLDVAKSGPYSLSATESFTRSDHTSNPSLGIGSITDANDLGARFSTRPGGGAVEAGLAYNFGLEAYELHADGNLSSCSDPGCTGTDFSAFNSTTHRFAADARWRFFPKTALLFDAAFELRNYSDASANVRTRPLLLETGIAGLITEKIRAAVKIGYANSFAQEGDAFSGPTAQLEAGWDPSETFSATLGAARALQPVSGTYGWYDDWRAYASAKVQLFGRLQLAADGSFDDILFGNSARADTQLQFDGSASMELARYVRLTAGCVLTRRDSSLGGVFSYQRAEIYLRAGFTY